MFKQFYPRGLMYLVAVCLLLGSASAGLAGETKKLKGNFDGVGNNFSGKFTHLGKFEGVLDPTTFTAVWTDKDGNTVTNQTTSFTITGELSPGVFTYEQTLVITGGTNAFAAATGSADVTGTIDFNTGAFDGHLDGTISKP